MVEPAKLPDDLVKDETKAAYQQIIKENTQLGTSIARTYGRVLDPADMRFGRLEFMIDQFFPQDTEKRAQAEIAWQKKIQNNLINLRQACKDDEFAAEKIWTPGSN